MFVYIIPVAPPEAFEPCAHRAVEAKIRRSAFPNSNTIVEQTNHSVQLQWQMRHRKMYTHEDTGDDQ